MNSDLQAAGELFTESEARRLVETILPMITADDAVVNVRHAREATTRFSNNAIAQGTWQDRLTVTLSATFGHRTGKASVDATDAEALRALVRRTEDAARLAPPDPEYLPSLGPQKYAAVAGFSEATSRLRDEDAARLAGEIISAAVSAGFKASGTIETCSGSTAVATRHGLFAYEASTLAQMGCTVASGDSSGYGRDLSPDIARLNASKLAAGAIEGARRSAAPRSVPAGRYTTLLLPGAVATLTAPVFSNARSTLDGLTYLSGRIGQKLAGESITLRSDPASPDLPYAPFDDEGVPRRPQVWVRNGVFSGMFWDRWTASRNGVEPVPYPDSFEMEGSDRSLDDLIAGIDRGLLVTRVWYVRYVKVDQTLLTGMTRDGTYWIEEGRIAYPVKNLRFNDTALGMLQRTSALGRPERSPSQWGLPGVVPPLVVQEWNFVGVTEF